jgi:hypothetical protein
MRRWLMIILGCWLWLAGSTAAQDNGLVAQNIVVMTEQDLYGQDVLYAKGSLVNQSGNAYGDVSLQATVFDARGNTVGEGSGYLVDVCGAGVLPDFVLQPGAAQPFAIPLELDDPTVTVDHVEIIAQGNSTEATPAATAAPLPGITRVSAHEVVAVEWIDAHSLRFGVGCWRDLFTDLEWFEYSLTGGTPQPAAHPKARLVTDALRRQLGLVDPLYFAHSFLTFAPNERRIVYQNELSSIYSAEPDGSFKRLLFDHLSNRTLQGITWLDKGNFLAYYYASYGDPVLYFTASLDGQVLSEPVANAIPSITVPGATPNGQQILISAEVNGKTGFYRKQAAYPTTDLLFEAEVPGNNWPGPLYEQDSDGSAFIYVALPVDSAAHLMCFNVQSKTLHDLTPLPLQLTTDERAGWWLSPDNSTIALTANGAHGGLWTVALDQLGGCE